MVKIEIISIGNELLSGFTVNTNASWLGYELARRGYRARWGSVIPDEKEELRDAFKRAGKRADVILVTGGLGPTHDDITKKTVSEYFNMPLKMHPKALKNVEIFFKRRNRPLSRAGKDQALIPEGAEVLTNSVGTASGMGIEHEGAVFIFMPGVPGEVKSIMNNEGFAYIAEKFPAEPLFIINLKTAGIYESKLSDRISDLIAEAGNDLAIAFLPKLTGVTLRIMAARENRERAEKFIEEVRARVGKYIYSEDGRSLEETVHRLLVSEKKTLAVAESCTGGLISHLLTNNPGSSEYLFLNAVTYSNQAKESLLKVNNGTLISKGAVSEEVAVEMAEGVRKLSDTDYGLSVTGIAGPGGGSEEKPVGLTYIAVADKRGKVKVKKFQFGSSREGNKLQAATAALNMLRLVMVYPDEWR